MGIPSYFKRLTESVRGIIVSSAGKNVAALLIDFNCIVYGCLRSQKLPAYTSEGEEAWEALLLEEVCNELVSIWKACQQPRTVFIAVDGVVPMAKIKQQRMRRFKSVWLAGKELEHGVRKPGEERWDTNSITPGTAFMEKLGNRLQKLCAARPGWSVSNSNEPGEGEHKVMKYIRDHTLDEGSVVIYGLDADLILLTMLTETIHLDAGKNPCYLMREKGEFTQKGGFGDVPYLFLSTSVLSTSISRGAADKKQFLLDYVAVMSVLGNDFVPHSLTLKIKEGGYDELLELVRGIGQPFVSGEGVLVEDSFQKLFALLAAREEGALFSTIQKKRKMRPMPPRNDAERLMLPVQGLPLVWFVEQKFLEGGQLSPRWREIYGVPEEAVAQYFFGLQWIMDYYLGKEVNRFWYYPWHHPPLWSSLVGKSMTAPIELYVREEIKPQEQLAIVLPIESWHLLRNPVLRKLPSAMPHMWPRQFGFVSLGKSWMWECEADIPILHIGRCSTV